MGLGDVVSFKFVAAAGLLAAKGTLYRMTPQGGKVGRLGGDGEWREEPRSEVVGVFPAEATGRFYMTDLWLGSDELAGDLWMEDAVISVSREKRIVKTELVGLNGTIKEFITNGDYQLSIIAGVVDMEGGRVMDRYPEEGVKALTVLLNRNEALWVKSDFLSLFGIDRLVVTNYKLEQMTHCNVQEFTISAASDEDYVIANNVY